jgi:hypothetical protein
MATRKKARKKAKRKSSRSKRRKKTLLQELVGLERKAKKGISKYVWDPITRAIKPRGHKVG